ncbi:MAG: hypothetical protein P1V97_08050, partial [Planctomycetota bacterium]|nr:hypothetical protein [Planctomycetota bacterium]
QNLEADMLHFLNTMRVKSDLWFKMTIDLVMLGARRGWVFGPLKRNFSEPALWPIIEKCLNAYGDGAFVRFFKGRLRPRFSKAAAEQSRNDLAIALKSKRVKDEVRGAAYYEYGTILFEAFKKTKTRTETVRRNGIEQFERALKFKIPCPDKAYEMLFSLSRDPRLKIEYGRKTLYWIHRRALRAQQAVDKEPVEEPCLVPYVLGDTDESTRIIRRSLIQVLNNLAEYKDALATIEKTSPFFKFDPELIERGIAHFGMKQINSIDLLKIVRDKGDEKDLARVLKLFPELAKKQ